MGKMRVKKKAKKDYRTPSEAFPDPVICTVHPKDAPLFLAIIKGDKHLRRYLRKTK